MAVWPDPFPLVFVCNDVFEVEMPPIPSGHPGWLCEGTGNRSWVHARRVGSAVRFSLGLR